VTQKTNLRAARRRDLDAINAVIEAAVMNWNLPERIKRLALPSYRYTNIDYEHLEILVSEMIDIGIVGVAGCEMAGSTFARTLCSSGSATSWNW